MEERVQYGVGWLVQRSHIISADEGVQCWTTKTAKGIYLGEWYFTDNPIIT